MRVYEPKLGSRSRLRSVKTPLILIVDDSDDNRELYAEYLVALSGFDTITAANGEEAISKAIAELPDLIVMDVSLPVVDGFEATRRLKADPTTSHIIVIVLTGHAEARYIEQAESAGCDRFIAKPCLPEQLVAEVRACLNLPLVGAPRRSA